MTSAIVRRLSCLCLLGLCSCYYLAQAGGQLDILAHRQPIGDILQGRQLSDEDARKLTLVADAKEFGERVLGLTKSDNYTTFYDTRGRPVSYVVSACRKDRFEAVTWWFPIVGTLPYKGFFSLDDARAEARALEAQGYDVALRTVAAYSTLGWFSDPVFSTMLKNDDIDLAVLILHELTHGTVFAGGQGDWNEAMAQFVGVEGAVQFFIARHGAESPEVKAARDRIEDEERVDEFVGRVHARLGKLYAAGGRDVIVRREQVWAEARDEFATVRRSLHDDSYDAMFRGRLNNADVQAQRRYGRLDVFRKVFDRVGRDWEKFFAAMREASAATDPFKALER